MPIGTSSSATPGMRPRENAKRGKLLRWDRYKHGAERDWMLRIQARFPHCEFGSSKPRELTVRSGDGRFTVYIGRLPDGQWFVSRRPMRRTFPSFEAMTEALRCWGFQLGG